MISSDAIHGFRRLFQQNFTVHDITEPLASFGGTPTFGWWSACSSRTRLRSSPVPPFSADGPGWGRGGRSSR